MKQQDHISTREFTHAVNILSRPGAVACFVTSAPVQVAANAPAPIATLGDFMPDHVA